MGTSGQPTEFTMGVPEDVKKMRGMLINLLQSGMRQGATPYTGPVAPQQNPMTLGAANLLNQMMGYGQYKQPGFMGYPGQYPQSGLKTLPGDISPKDGGGGGYVEPKPDVIEKKRLKKK